MSTMDIIVLSLMLLFFIMGFIRGFIEEIFHFIAMFGAAVAAYFSYPFFYEKITFLKITASAKTVIAFVIAYILFALLLLIIGWSIKKAVHFALLGWIDRLLGGVVGIGKAAIITWIFMISVSLLPASSLKSSISQSITYQQFRQLPFRVGAPHIKSFTTIDKNVRKSIRTIAQPLAKETKKTSEKISTNIKEITSQKLSENHSDKLKDISSERLKEISQNKPKNSSLEELKEAGTENTNTKSQLKSGKSTGNEKIRPSSSKSKSDSAEKITGKKDDSKKNIRREPETKSLQTEKSISKTAPNSTKDTPLKQKKQFPLIHLDSL